jgi:hypothetical protein
MKILLGDFNATIGRKNIFKSPIWNNSLHDTYDDNRVGILIFVIS